MAEPAPAEPTIAIASEGRSATESRTTPAPVEQSPADTAVAPEPTRDSTTVVSQVEGEPESNTEVDASPVTYRVRTGDTLWGIALAHGVALDAILAANEISDPDTIWAGSELIIPGGQAPAPAASAAHPTAPPSASPVIVPSDDIPAPSTPQLQQVFPTLPALPQQALLEPMLHDWQKMNNCAPTTVAMAMSYFDVLVTQFDTAPALKGGAQDKNVSPPEIVSYLRDQGFGARVAVNGNIELIQQFVNHNIPVIVEQWLDRPDDALTGHYRLVRGYDQTTEQIIVNDSYSGPQLHFSYNEFDRLWRPFNRIYVPVYPPDQEATVQAILGPDWDTQTMYRRAAETASAEIEAGADAYAWFNLGTSVAQLGDYEAAAAAYDQAISIGLPPRMLWYQFGPFEAYNKVGRHRDVLELSAPLTGLALEELHYQRGVAFEALGQRSMAVAEYQRAADLNSRLVKAAESVARLRDQSSTEG